MNVFNAVQFVAVYTVIPALTVYLAQHGWANTAILCCSFELLASLILVQVLNDHKF